MYTYIICICATHLNETQFNIINLQLRHRCTQSNASHSTYCGYYSSEHYQPSDLDVNDLIEGTGIGHVLPYCQLDI